MHAQIFTSLCRVRLGTVSNILFLLSILYQRSKPISSINKRDIITERTGDTTTATIL